MGWWTLPYFGESGAREIVNTEEMVKDQTWAFLFTLGPSRITGAVQAIVNPIAIK